jgi:hypothetical protein
VAARASRQPHQTKPRKAARPAPRATPTPAAAPKAENQAQTEPLLDYLFGGDG